MSLWLLAIVEYVGWFNDARLHESLGDVPPAESETLSPDSRWKSGSPDVSVGDVSGLVTVGAAGRGWPASEISLQWGYLLALGGTLLAMGGSILRSAESGRRRKPPGVL